jgi:hypothetical protein
MRRSFAILAVPAGVLAAAVAHAADWQVNPRIEAGYQYDDNYRLALDGNETEVSGALADVRFEFKRVTPVAEFSFTPRARATFFPDEPEEESEDYFGVIKLIRRSQKVEGGLTAEYALEDIVNSEQPGSDIDTGLGEPGIGEGGRLLLHNRRELVNVHPYLTHQVTQRHTMLYDLRYVDVGFDEEVPGVQTAYTDADATIGWSYAFSERSAFTTRARGSRYNIGEQDQNSNGYGLEIELGSDTTQTTRAFVRVGAQVTDLLQPLGGSEEHTSVLGGLGIRWTGGLTEFFADATRDVSPISTGVIVDRDQLRLRLDRAITPRFGFFFGVRGIRDEAVDDESLFQGRRYATGDFGVSWRMLQQFSIVAAVNYTWQEFDVDPSDATSSGATLNLLWEPRRPE